MRKKLVVLLVLILTALAWPVASLGRTVGVSARFDNLRGTESRAAFEYSDQLFAGAATKLNGALALASVSLGASAGRAEYALDALGQMGFAKARAFDYASGAASGDRSAHVLARKSVTLGGEAYTVYALTISGTRGLEWLSNFDLGTGPEHAGFSAAADEVIKNLAAYVDTPAERNILWISGHSRGAAVGNIVGARLSASGVLANAARIFCYTSATPATTRKGAHYGKRAYKNLIALQNPADFITQIPFKAWGYTVYGRTVKLPGSGKAFNAMKEKVRAMTGEAYAGQQLKVTRQMVNQALKYAPGYKGFVAGRIYRDRQGTHDPAKYFGGLSRLLAGDATRQQGLSMLLEEVEKSNYAVNLTALMAGLKLPCTRSRLIKHLLGADLDNLTGGMPGIAYAHSLEAYVGWAQALYG